MAAQSDPLPDRQVSNIHEDDPCSHLPAPASLTVCWAPAIGLTPLRGGCGQAASLPSALPLFPDFCSLKRGNCHSPCPKRLKERFLTTYTDRTSQFRFPDFTLTLYQGEKWHQDPLSQAIQKQLLLETVDQVRELGGFNSHLLKSLQGPSPMNNYFGSLWPTLPKLWSPNAMLQCGMFQTPHGLVFLAVKMWCAPPCRAVTTWPELRPTGTVGEITGSTTPI